MEEYAQRTGRVWEWGGLVGVYNGQLVVTAPQRTDEPNSIDLGRIARETVRQYPGFRVLYDYHLHTRPGPLGNTGGVVDPGFHREDAYLTSIREYLRGSFMITPDRVQFMTREQAGEASRGERDLQGTTLRRWRREGSQRR
jgi:hypothetical protein